MSVLGTAWGLRRAQEDAPDWQRAQGNAIGRRVGLQPWRFLDGLPPGTRVETIEPAVPERPGPLADFYDDHPERGTGAQVTLKGGARRSYAFENVIVLRGHVFMEPGTSRLARLPFYQSDSYPQPGLEVVEDRAALTTGVNREFGHRIHDPVLVADTRHTGYGHLLLEVVPRLAHLERLPRGTKVLTGITSSKARHWLFEAMGVKADQVLKLKGPALCRQAFALDNLVDVTGFISPQSWQVYERIISAVSKESTITPPERLFISRRGIERRKLRNELEIEQLFARYGFEIVQPETLAIPDQVKLFSSAKFIAGPRGSGMHNVVFAQPDARILEWAHRQFIPAIDIILVRHDHALAIAVGDAETGEGHPLFMPWTIDLGLVERALKAHFGL